MSRVLLALLVSSVIFKFDTMPDLKIVEIVHRRIK